MRINNHHTQQTFKLTNEVAYDPNMKSLDKFSKYNHAFSELHNRRSNEGRANIIIESKTRCGSGESIQTAVTSIRTGNAVWAENE